MKTYDDLTRRPLVRCFFAAGMRLGVAAREVGTEGAASPGKEDAVGEVVPSTSSMFLLIDRVTLVLLGGGAAGPTLELRVFRVLTEAEGVSISR